MKLKDEIRLIENDTERIKSEKEEIVSVMSNFSKEVDSFLKEI